MEWFAGKDQFSDVWQCAGKVGQQNQRIFDPVRHGNRLLPCLTACEEPVATVVGWTQTEQGSGGVAGKWCGGFVQHGG
jgi:hypothetical protein